MHCLTIAHRVDVLDECHRLVQVVVGDIFALLLFVDYLQVLAESVHLLPQFLYGIWVVQEVTDLLNSLLTDVTNTSLSWVSQTTQFL